METNSTLIRNWLVNDNWSFTFTFLPQNTSAGTSPRANTPYVDQQVLNSCIEDFFGVTLKSFDESRRGHNGRFTGAGPSYLPANPNGEGGTATYTITNSVDYSNKDLQKMDAEWFGGRPPEPGKKLVGFELPGYPLRNYTGSDNGPMQMIMTQVHELGHFVGRDYANRLRQYRPAFRPSGLRRANSRRLRQKARRF
jgi:hypothetical protein